LLPNDTIIIAPKILIASIDYKDESIVNDCHCSDSNPRIQNMI
jgi:hypothetical protein